MASTRAAEVAEVLWELKRADKLATYSVIAQRAGFSAGSNGRTMTTCLKRVRRDWPHLEWWRAIADDAVIEPESEHANVLQESGYQFEPVDGKGKLTLSGLEELLMTWSEESEDEA